MTAPEGSKQLPVVLKDELALGTYANSALIVHNYAEFVLDFARFVPGRGHLQVVSRIVMAPVHVKELLEALAENVAIYERHFGEIPHGPPVVPPDQPSM